MEVKLIRLNKKNNYKVIDYLYKTGTIKGKKKINQLLTVPIIEFKDYTRLWILTEEIIVIQR